MEVNREAVLEWLDKHRRTRKWLQEKCDVSKQAVSNWLREKNPQAISSNAQMIIQSLMTADEAAEQAQASVPQNLVLEFSSEDFAAIEQASVKQDLTVRKWATKTLNAAASLTLDELVEIVRANKSTHAALRVAEESATYGEPSNKVIDPTDEAKSAGGVNNTAASE